MCVSLSIVVYIVTMERSRSQPQHHPAGHLVLRKLLTELCRCEVRFIVTGSVAALAYGVRLAPTNLDLIIADSEKNRIRLNQLLHSLGAAQSGMMAGPPAGRVNTRYGAVVLIPADALAFTELVESAIWADAWQLHFPMVPPAHLLRFWQELDRPADWPRMEQLAAVRERVGLAGGIWAAEEYLDWATPKPPRQPTRDRRRR